jgi:hypothetical protein
MSYFEDLSDYTYFSRVSCARTKNVGWLDSAHEFNNAAPTEELLDSIWDFCKVSVAQTRGIHECGWCPTGPSHYVERKGEKLMLGAAEIRVFAKDGVAMQPQLLCITMSPSITTSRPTNSCAP